MRLSRIAFIFIAAYFALIGGGAYYYQFFPIRVLHHAVVTVLLVVWLLLRVRRGLPSTALNPLVAALIGVWALSAVFSLEPRSAFENLWFPLTHVIMFFIIADLLGRGRESLVIETFFLVSAVIVLLALAQLLAWYTGIDLISESGVGWLNVGMILPPETPMIYVPLGVSTWLAGFAAPTLIMALGWALSSSRRAYRTVFFCLAGALMVVLIGAFSRGGFVACAVGIGVLIGLRILRSRLSAQHSSQSVHHGQVVRPVLLAGLTVALIATVIGLILLMGRNEARSTGDVLRFGLWGGAATMVVNDPLTGVGPGLFARAYREIRPPGSVDDRLSTAHNAYLNSAAETGIPGIVVMIGFGMIIAYRWWTLWRGSDSPTRHQRLEGAMAALLALGVQSFFDTFLYTPLVLLSLVLIAYCTIEPSSLLMQIPSRLNRSAAAVLALLLIGYGVAFIQFDRAQAAFNRSVREGDLGAAQEAAALDPYLNLYQLQIAYLVGQGDDLAAAREAYESAVKLEPTWETGWLNLALLRERVGDVQGALDALTTTMNIRIESLGALNWARVADDHAAASEEQIIAHYQLAMTLRYLPLSDFWTATELRRQALNDFMRKDNLPLNWRYRIAALRDIDYAVTLVPESPVSAEEWWVTGEYALNLQSDEQRAVEAFSEAIRLDRANGDYYVARARAELISDPVSARRDLDIADMLYTFYEYPAAVRLALADSSEESLRLRIAAVPPRVIDQNFEGVLFQGRVASFDVFPELRNPGYGSDTLQPWYDLASEFELQGQLDAATNVYRAILDVAPADQYAADALAHLLPGS